MEGQAVRRLPLEPTDGSGGRAELQPAHANDVRPAPSHAREAMRQVDLQAQRTFDLSNGQRLGHHGDPCPGREARVAAPLVGRRTDGCKPKRRSTDHTRSAAPIHDTSGPAAGTGPRGTGDRSRTGPPRCRRQEPQTGPLPRRNRQGSLFVETWLSWETSSRQKVGKPRRRHLCFISIAPTPTRRNADNLPSTTSWPGPPYLASTSGQAEYSMKAAKRQS